MRCDRAGGEQEDPGHRSPPDPGDRTPETGRDRIDGCTEGDQPRDAATPRIARSSRSGRRRATASRAARAARRRHSPPLTSSGYAGAMMSGAEVATTVGMASAAMASPPRPDRSHQPPIEEDAPARRGRPARTRRAASPHSSSRTWSTGRYLSPRYASRSLAGIAERRKIPAAGPGGGAATGSGWPGNATVISSLTETMTIPSRMPISWAGLHGARSAMIGRPWSSRLMRDPGAGLAVGEGERADDDRGDRQRAAANASRGAASNGSLAARSSSWRIADMDRTVAEARAARCREEPGTAVRAGAAAGAVGRPRDCRAMSTSPARA